MAGRTSIAIYNINDERLCTLFDSRFFEDGGATGIEVTKNRNGWKEMKFNVPFYMADGSANFRIPFLKNENLLYYYEDGEPDVYTIKVPTDSHGNKQVSIEIRANHISEELKAKNLYKYFDDENGIGTCETLIGRALAGTGWTLAYCDKFYEADGVTEKIRSYSCNTKTGAYTMISGICELFKARPIFNGYERTVEIHANQNTNGFIEMNFSKNMDSISRKLDSSNVVTRLYVEGEYGDFGYVGIDSVNPTGLPFILNFDYYKEIGLFKAEHQTALDNYTSTYATLTENIRNATTQALEVNALLISLIGTCGYIYSPIQGGVIITGQMIAGGDYTEADKSYKAGDTVALVQANGYYTYATYPVSNLSGYAHIIKFLPTITGLMAAHEDLIHVSNDAVPEHLANLNRFLRKNNYAQVTSVSQLRTIYGVTDLSVVDDDDFDVSGIAAPYNLDTVRSYTASIGEAENTSALTQAELNGEMLRAISYMKQVDTLTKNIAGWQEDQADAEDTFVGVMGTMLRDGYWSDDNYTVGQEESLYQDALGISATLAFPIKTYNVDYKAIAAVEGYEDEEPELSTLVRIYDDVLGIDDYVYIDETHEYPDDRKKDNVNLTTDLLNLANKTFSTMIDRITELANDVKNNRDIYKRAAAISKDGKFSSALLEGAISTLTSRLTSVSSNWTTDDKGNIVFTSLDGDSAMMLSGYGFMVANSKNLDGSWNWRTFGTGEGFTADMIVTGFLDAERIEARSITVQHLSSGVGESLDISSNVSIVQQAQAIDGLETAMQELTPEKIVTTVTSSQKYQTDITQLSDRITAQATDIDGLEAAIQELTPEKIVLTVTSSQKYQGDIGGLQGDITDVQDDISNIQGDVTGIQGDITNINGDITNLQSQITQTAASIDLKVSKGDVSSQLSVESGKITINSDRISIDSTNFTLTEQGNVTAKSFEATDYIYLNGDITSYLKIPYQYSYRGLDDGRSGYIEIGDPADSLYSRGVSIYGKLKNSDGTTQAENTISMLHYILMDGHNYDAAQGDTDFFTRIGSTSSATAGVQISSSQSGASFKSTDMTLSRIGFNTNCYMLQSNNSIHCDLLYVSGTKSRVVGTEDYSERLLYCYEMPSPMFGDIGSGKISEDGKCYISLDPTFVQTIGGGEYHVFLQTYGKTLCYVVDRKGDYFIVEGDPGTEFSWEVKAKQKNFENLRLEKVMDQVDTNNQTDPGAKAYAYLEKLREDMLG